MAGDADLVEVLRRSQSAGFLGPGDVGVHIRHAAAFARAVDPPRAFLDLGSGGGVPGLVLARSWPDAHGTLLDAQQRRVRFLASAIDELGLGDRIGALHGRAEEVALEPGHRGRYDVVTARSFGPPATTAECGAGFLVAGGRLLVAEPPEEQDRWPAPGLAGIGLVDEGLIEGAGQGGGSVRRLRSVAGPTVGVPRRAPAMRRRPAF